ncbi:hypothetical protein GPAL_0222 [Glaciecola pallidula DSM 14239 = ACAM 615]|uniref:Uncharacterized protein n=1 Tax=Brumicola pallidula DSM 14239 = ACAM 615 TaxID=1121922 RepID=K6ZDS0_9ALTE|nr:hypothetical protein GPAL_0222 [Glaciecola pallidula DSM 14239 = ACAM 615]
MAEVIHYPCFFMPIFLLNIRCIRCDKTARVTLPEFTRNRININQ